MSNNLVRVLCHTSEQTMRVLFNRIILKILSLSTENLLEAHQETKINLHFLLQ